MFEMKHNIVFDSFLKVDGQKAKRSSALISQDVKVTGERQAEGGTTAARVVEKNGESLIIKQMRMLNRLEEPGTVTKG